VSHEPPTTREIDAFRDQSDRFIADLDEEYYLHFAGLKDTLDVEEVYERYEDLTRLETAQKLQGAPSELWRFACEGFLGNLTREHQARAAQVEDGLLSPATTLLLQMEVPFAEALEVARRTRAASGRVIWNLAPVPENMTGGMIRDLLGATDYLITNEHEALDAASALGLPPTDFEAAAASLAKQGQLTCVVTAGAQGAFAFAPGGIRSHVPALAITPIDTTGAGDTFAGAFACLISENASLQRALEVGCEAAALKCLKLGAQNGMPLRSEIKVLGAKPPR